MHGMFLIYYKLIFICPGVKRMRLDGDSSNQEEEENSQYFNKYFSDIWWGVAQICICKSMNYFDPPE